jgi:hypothetical protein
MVVSRRRVENQEPFRAGPRRPAPAAHPRRRRHEPPGVSGRPRGGIVSPGVHASTVVLNDGGSAAVPSSRSSLKVCVHTVPPVRDRTAY